MSKIIRPGGWRGITRAGQKVICVEEFIAICGLILTAPQVGIIYTVAGFEDFDGEPSITLNEVRSYNCLCRGNRRVPFPLVGFRPIDDVEKKSEAVTKMMDDILRKTKIDTRVPEDA